MHVVVERRAKAVQEGDAAEPRASGGGRVGFNRYDCRSAQQSLDLGKKDFREGRDGWGSVGKKAPQSLRHGDHPLPHGHRRDDVIGEMRGRLGHVAAVAGRADAAALAGEGHDESLAAAGAQRAALPAAGIDSVSILPVGQIAEQLEVEVFSEKSRRAVHEHNVDTARMG